MDHLFPDTGIISFLRGDGFLGCGIIPNVSTAQNGIPDVAQWSQGRALDLFSVCVFFKSHRNHSSLITANDSNRRAWIYSSVGLV